MESLGQVVLDVLYLHGCPIYLKNDVIQPNGTWVAAEVPAVSFGLGHLHPHLPLVPQWLCHPAGGPARSPVRAGSWWDGAPLAMCLGSSPSAFAVA